MDDQTATLVGLAAASILTAAALARAAFVSNRRRRLARALAAARTQSAQLQAEMAARTARLSEAQAALSRAEQHLATARAAQGAAEAALVREEAAREAERQSQARAMAALTALKGSIETDLKALAQDALRESTQVFLDQAAGRFEVEARANRDGVAGLVAPLHEALKAYETRIETMEAARRDEEGALREQVRHLLGSTERLDKTASSLTTALQSAPKTRGRWGEQQLMTVLDMAGMARHIDYRTEVPLPGLSGTDTEAGLRPDVILRLPGDRCIVIDAKTSLTAYLEAVETEGAERDRLLKDHARAMRNHARLLGSKAYWQALPNTPDFVVMFVPGDGLYAAALEQDPDLFDFAHRQQVVIATPSTFLALAKAMAFGWRQDQASRDARRVLEAGTELYRRVGRLAEHLSGVSRALDQTVRKHNALVGAVQSRVLPAARRLHDLGLGEADGEVADVAQADEVVRLPAPRATERPGRLGDLDPLGW